jgi:hypothetical protein
MKTDHEPSAVGDPYSIISTRMKIQEIYNALESHILKNIYSANCEYQCQFSYAAAMVMLLACI